MRISDPVRSSARSAIWPSTHVPLRDPRSRSSTRPSRATTSACQRDTLRSSSATSLDGSRPIVNRPPSKPTTRSVASAAADAAGGGATCVASPASHSSRSPAMTISAPGRSETGVSTR